MGKSIKDQLEEQGIINPVPPPPPAPPIPPILPGQVVVRRKKVEDEPLPLAVPPPEEERPLVNLRNIRTAQALRVDDLEKRIEELEKSLANSPIQVADPVSESSPDSEDTVFDLSVLEGRIEFLEREVSSLKRKTSDLEQEIPKRVTDLERLCAGIMISVGMTKRPEIAQALKHGKALRPSFTTDKNGKLLINIEVLK